MDPLAGSPWSAPDTVAGFSRTPPNEALLRFAQGEHAGRGRVALDIGCGAGRNAVPLAASGWDVIGTDLSRPMLAAAAARAREDAVSERVHLVLAPMERLPVRSGSADLVVAHGIWNLARSSHEFRAAVREAARAARPGGALFVFTFSRTTLPSTAAPVPGERFIFTDFSGEPQCFLHDHQLLAELGAAGFTPDPGLPLRELNRPLPRQIRTCTGPVIFEGGFRRIP